MHLKQYTDNDYFLFWLLHNRENGPETLKTIPGMRIEFVVEEPTPYLIERHLGSYCDLQSLKITDDYWREYINRRTTSDLFMQNASENLLYLTLPDEKMHHIGKRLMINVLLYNDHPNITEQDWWYEDRPEVKFTALQWFTYLGQSARKGYFIDPVDMGIDYPGCPDIEPKSKAVPGLFTSIFCPRSEEDIMAANTMAYILFDGLWDCPALNEEFREKSGVDIMMSTRKAAIA
jgi:hypothetical protein